MMLYNIFVLLIMLSCLKSINPMKMCMCLTLYCFLISLNMWIITGSTMSSIFLSLLFVGGIIMMFMLISSVNSNYSSKSWINSMLVLTMMMMITMITTYTPVLQETMMTPNKMMKLMMNKYSTIMLCLMLLTSYFTLCYILWKKNKSSLRYILWLKKMYFVIM